jgi:hypothetical protein
VVVEAKPPDDHAAPTPGEELGIVEGSAMAGLLTVLRVL